MASAFLSESVLEKTATLAVGCCIAGGLLTVSAAAAPVVVSGVSLGAVLGALGLRTAIKDSPECEKAWKVVFKRLPREFVHAQDADEAAVSTAANRLGKVLNKDDLFKVDALKAALQLSHDVAEGLTLNALKVVSAADPVFAQPGLHRDLAEALFSAGFVAARDACDEFRGKASLAVGETTLGEVREASRTAKQTAASVAAMEAKLDAFIAAGGAVRAKAAGLNAKQVRALLRAFAHEGVPVDQAETLLLKAAEELTSLRARLLSLTNADPGTRDLRTAAAAAIQAGELDRARDLVLQAANRHRRAGDELADSLRAHRLSESEALAEAAGLEQSLSRLREAAALYERAAETARPFDPDAAWGHRLDQADALQRHGELFPGLDSLRQAVTALRDHALPLAPRETRPADWAGTQNNLGNALGVLGARAGGEAGRTALNDAVAAFEAALRVYTEADMPAQWAMTQNNLGGALRVLGERAGGGAGRG